jgi:RNA polymerase sigma-70 factor (ECF subfamily)
VADHVTVLRFEQAVLPHLDAAYNLARWLLRDAHDAEDIVQQSCLRALDAFDRFRGGDTRAWLLTIVRNACFSHLRQSRRHDEDVETVGSIDTQLAAPSAESDPHLALLRRLERDALAAAIEQLPAVFREAFVLREMEGLSYQEIADVAGVPVGTVMSRLARARQRLQETLSNPVQEQ